MTTTQTELSLATRIAQDGITATCRRVDRNPQMDDMPLGSTHWRVTLSGPRGSMTTPFSQGPAISGLPTAETVLECLLSDANGADESFDRWCDDLGMDSDSRRAEHIYRSVVKQTAALRAFLGADFDAYLTETIY